MTAEESATSGVRLVQVYLIVSRTGCSSQGAQKLAPAKADAKRAHRLATPQQVGWAKLAPAKAGAKRPSPLWRLAHAVRTRGEPPQRRGTPPKLSLCPPTGDVVSAFKPVGRNKRKRIAPLDLSAA